MHEVEMDGFDRAILKALQQDASLTNAALGDRVNLSASQCSRRRAALEAAGVIAGYSARLDPAQLGFGMRAMIRVNLRGHSQKEDDSFIDFVRRQPPVITAHSVSGDADYVLEVLVRDLASFAEFIHNRLLPHPQVGQVRSEIVLKTIKPAQGLPLD
ncbi:MAG: Lrp/AsnC family transcriptional regulator [Paracoccaceae bacterium]